MTYSPEFKSLNFAPRRQKIGGLDWAVFIFLLASAVLSFFALHASAQNDGQLKVYFLDVGQGDAEFIQAPNGNQILIDGGPDGKVIQELGRIMPFYDRTIDMIILTHPHADHMNGLIEVLKKYKVDRILENDVAYDTAEHAEWERVKLASQITEARAGQVIDAGEGVKLTILYPYQLGSAGKIIKNFNNVHDYMVVSRLDYGNESVMFAGDAEAKVEDELIRKDAKLNADFLKVGHHGSKTSTTEEFLDAVKPKDAFIEVGAKNRYGHPHPSTIRRLEDHNIKYYRTDIDGTSKLTLDGQSYRINK